MYMYNSAREALNQKSWNALWKQQSDCGSKSHPRVTIRSVSCVWLSSWAFFSWRANFSGTLTGSRDNGMNRLLSLIQTGEKKFLGVENFKQLRKDAQKNKEIPEFKANSPSQTKEAKLVLPASVENISCPLFPGCLSVFVFGFSKRPQSATDNTNPDLWTEKLNPKTQQNSHSHTQSTHHNFQC